MVANSGAMEMIENIGITFHEKNNELAMIANSFIETYMKFVNVDENNNQGSLENNMEGSRNQEAEFKI